MDILILYDSLYGNTQEIAEAIACGFSKTDKVKLVKVSGATIPDLKSANLFVVGSPTQGGRPTPAITKFLNDLPSNGLKGKNVAAFDTRISFEDSGKFVRFIMKMLGFAAPKMAKVLETKGGKVTIKPEGFAVLGKEGPLKKGEIEKASAWAKKVR